MHMIIPKPHQTSNERMIISSLSLSKLFYFFATSWEETRLTYQNYVFFTFYSVVRQVTSDE